MPIYSYICKSCGKKFERLEVVIPNEEELKCPHCSNTNVEKEFSSFSVGKSSGRESSAPAPSAPGCSTCPGAGTCGGMGY